MKLINKFKIVLLLLALGVLAIAALLAGTVIKNSEEMDKHYSRIVKAEAYSDIKIIDCNGKEIYNGAFSKDSQLRKSTFHIVGDKYGSIPSSVLTKTVSKMKDTNIFSGYKSIVKIVNLTIDSDLQKGAYTLLTNQGYKGCIVVVDYTTGEVKAIASTPTVDVFDAEKATEGAFLNKATSTYPPGSVFKAVSAAAMLESTSSVKSFIYNCSGVQEHVSCYNRTAHGEVTLRTALKYSCNCAIAKYADTYLTSESLYEYANRFGILEKNIISDFETESSTVNKDDDVMWASNGQGMSLISPVAIASFFGTIANKGTRVPLHIYSETKVEAEPVITESSAQYLKNALTANCDDMNLKYFAFGKTGTAELDNAESHAWFACSIYDELAPTYTIITFVEHGGFSSVAKNLSRDFINAYITKGD